MLNLPKTRLRFSDGAELSVGTVPCDDKIHEAVYLGYTPAGSTTTTMALELPPHAVDLLIQHLQERANHARFINGDRLLEYPEPYPVLPAGNPGRPRKTQRSKTKKGQQDAPPK